MSEQWYYSRDGKQLGPVSGDELRRMASAGELQPTDQIWKEGMPKWATANKLKGLAFPAEAKKSTSGPPPLEQPSEKPPTLSETLIAAGSLAANQAKKAQLNSVSLPAAYLRLGKHVFEKRIGEEIFVTEFDELDELAGQIKDFDEAGKGSGPTAKGFAENAKALARNATDAAKKKMATVRFDQALTRLGKGAFEQRGNLNLPQQLIDRIEDHNQQIESLDELIQTTTVPNPGWSVFENRFAHSVLAVLLFPVGLFLIWRSDLWSKQAKLIWTGAIALLFAAGVLSPKREDDGSRNSHESSSVDSAANERGSIGNYDAEYNRMKDVGREAAKNLNRVIAGANRIPANLRDEFIRTEILRATQTYRTIQGMLEKMIDHPSMTHARRISESQRDGWSDGFNAESEHFQVDP